MAHLRKHTNPTCMDRRFDRRISWNVRFPTQNQTYQVHNPCTISTNRTNIHLPIYFRPITFPNPNRTSIITKYISLKYNQKIVYSIPMQYKVEYTIFFVNKISPKNNIITNNLK